MFSTPSFSTSSVNKPASESILFHPLSDIVSLLLLLLFIAILKKFSFFSVFDFSFVCLFADSSDGDTATGPRETDNGGEGH